MRSLMRGFLFEIPEDVGYPIDVKGFAQAHNTLGFGRPVLPVDGYHTYSQLTLRAENTPLSGVSILAVCNHFRSSLID